MTIRHLASAAAVAGALLLAAPAVAQDIPDTPNSPCPDAFIPVFDPFNVTGEDRNDNDVVCVKPTGGGDIFKDDRV